MLARHRHIVEKDIALRISANAEVAFFELDIDTGLRAAYNPQLKLLVIFTELFEHIAAHGNGREALR